jgi:outer membrane protein assembly factor BamE
MNCAGFQSSLNRCAFGLIVWVMLLAGCASERDRLMKERYPTYPATIQHAIDRRALMRGMTHEQVWLSLGEPMCKKTIQQNDKPVELWLYPPAGRNPCLDAETKVFFEDGVVSGWK